MAMTQSSDLNASLGAGVVHAGGDVNGVAPDVVERFLRTHHTRDDGAHVEA